MKQRAASNDWRLRRQGAPLMACGDLDYRRAEFVCQCGKLGAPSANQNSDLMIASASTGFAQRAAFAQGSAQPTTDMHSGPFANMNRAE